MQSIMDFDSNNDVFVRGLRIMDDQGTLIADIVAYGAWFPVQMNITKGKTGRLLKAYRLYAKFLYLMRVDILMCRRTRFILAVKKIIFRGINNEAPNQAVNPPAAIEKKPDDDCFLDLFNSLTKREQKISLYYLRFLVATKAWKGGIVQKTIKKVMKFAAYYL